MILLNSQRFTIRNERDMKQDLVGGQISAVIAVLLLILIIIMIILGIHSGFSEQKTVFYMVAVLSSIAFFTLIGVSIFLLRRAHETHLVKKSYENRHLNLLRYQSQQFLTESQVKNI